MLKVELRGNGKVHISGYVNAVERFSKPIRDESGKCFIEKISAGAFERAIERANDIDVMLNHERTITSVKKSGITLKEDNVGLLFDGDISDDEVVQRAKNKELVGWSFGFRPIDPHDVESERSGISFERTVDEMELIEVSIIDKRFTPCYPATSIFARAEKDVSIDVRAQNECEYVFLNDGKGKLELRRRRLEFFKK